MKKKSHGYCIRFSCEYTQKYGDTKKSAGADAPAAGVHYFAESARLSQTQPTSSAV